MLTEEKNEILGVSVERINDSAIAGFTHQKNQYADDYTVHFVSKFSKPIGAMDAWGTQRDLTPLWTLLSPKQVNSWVNALLTLPDRSGWIPEAPAGLEYAPVMGAQYHNALIVSSYQREIRNFDAQKAWRAIRHNLTTPGATHPCGGYADNRLLGVYNQYGFVPDEDGAVSNTLEHAYDDCVAAQFTRALDKTADDGFFTKRPQNYRNIFDPTTKFMCRKHRDNTWLAGFDPFQFGTTGGWNGPGYMEGNAWLFTFFVPHDVPGLIGLLGRDLFSQRLGKGFEKDYIDFGNQPNLQTLFLFNYSGKSWLTQKYSRLVPEKFSAHIAPIRGRWAEKTKANKAYCTY